MKQKRIPGIIAVLIQLIASVCLKSGLILPRQVYYNKTQKHIRRTKDDETKENPGNHSSFDSINCICLL